MAIAKARRTWCRRTTRRPWQFAPADVIVSGKTPGPGSGDDDDDDDDGDDDDDDDDEDEDDGNDDDDEGDNENDRYENAGHDSFTWDRSLFVLLLDCHWP